MYEFKHKGYETLLEAVDVSYRDNGIFNYKDTLEIWEDKIALGARISLEDLELMSEEDYFDFDISRVRTKDDLMKQFEIKEIK
jgi:hypothetical protein